MKIVKQKKLYIFDLDGTLVNAYRAVACSLNYTRQRFGFPKVSYDDAKMKLGRGQNKFIETFFPNQNMKDVLDTYRRHHKKALLKHAKLRPNSKKLLSVLKRKGKLIAIASNRPYKFTKLITEQLGIIKYIDYILCADQVGKHKPDPLILDKVVSKMRMNNADAVYIGDMLIDYQTAKRAGIDFIFIRGGSSVASQVKRIKIARKINNLIFILTINAK